MSQVSYGGGGGGAAPRKNVSGSRKTALHIIGTKIQANTFSMFHRAFHNFGMLYMYASSQGHTFCMYRKVEPNPLFQILYSASSLKYFCAISEIYIPKTHSVDSENNYTWDGGLHQGAGSSPPAGDW